MGSLGGLFTARLDEMVGGKGVAPIVMLDEFPHNDIHDSGEIGVVCGTWFTWLFHCSNHKLHTC